jgi:serine/threonine-protein kinase
VKPDNVHLLPDGRVKLTDFGIARLMFEATLTSNGQVFGTPSYMSPEQVAGKSLDARSDLFSLGVMLYEMVAGRKPFTGDSVITITYNIMNVAPAPLTGVPASADRIVARALAKDPSLRYRSAGEMAEEMRRAQTDFGQRPRTAGPGPASSPAWQPLSPSPPRAGTGNTSGGRSTGSAPPSLPGTGGGMPGAPSNPFGHLQPDDLWFPRPSRRRPSLSPRVRGAFSSLVILSIVGLILWFLCWSTWTAWQEFQYAGNRKTAEETAEKAHRMFSTGRFAEAAKLYHDAWRLAPTHPPMRVAKENAAVAAIRQGHRHVKNEQFSEAYDWFRRAVAYDADYPASYSELGFLNYRDGRGDMEQADRYWLRAIQLWEQRAIRATESNARLDAQRELEKLQRNVAVCWYNHAVLLEPMGRIPEAQYALRRAMYYGANTDVAMLAQQRLESYTPNWGGGS